MPAPKPMGGSTKATPNKPGESVNRMHQMGHDYYATQCPEKCGKADEHVARRYITPREFLAAARGQHTIAEVAERLFATPSIVAAYIDGLPPDERLIMDRMVGHELV